MKKLLTISIWTMLTCGLFSSVQAGDLVNLSARSTVGSGEDTFIVGFVVVGDPGELTPILALGSGPIHPDIQNPIADPNITLFKSIPGMLDEVIDSNDNWKEGGQMFQISSTGIPPEMDASSGLVSWLEPGSYTFHLADNSGSGGVGIAEVYEMVFKDIPNSLMDAESLDRMVSVLQAATPNTDVMAQLSGEGPFTIFVPADSAFSDLSEDDWNDFLADPNRAAGVSLYHIFEGELPAFGITTSQIVMADTNTVTLWAKEDGSINFNEATVIESDFIATNGVIHVIDTRINPPVGQDSLVGTIGRMGNFSIVENMASSIGLPRVGHGHGNGPFTLFAPTDDAFEALPEGYIAGLTNAQKLDLLEYIVVAGSLEAASLTTGSLTALQGADLNIVVSEEGAITINGANVILADIEASDGILHVIDAVPIPPSP